MNAVSHCQKLKIIVLLIYSWI